MTKKTVMRKCSKILKGNRMKQMTMMTSLICSWVKMVPWIMNWTWKIISITMEYKSKYQVFTFRSASFSQLLLSTAYKLLNMLFPNMKGNKFIRISCIRVSPKFKIMRKFSACKIGAHPWDFWKIMGQPLKKFVRLQLKALKR